MLVENKENKIVFKLIGIKTEQFAILADVYDPLKEVELRSNFEIKTIESDRQIGLFMEFEFLHEVIPFLKLELSCHFVFENETWLSFINDVNAEIRIPKDVATHLLMLTIGTCRGVLFAKTENTIFSKFILPPLNVNEMISDDVYFDLMDDK